MRRIRDPGAALRSRTTRAAHEQAMALFSSLRNRFRRAPEREAPLAIEREGQAHIDHVGRAARDLPWLASIAELAWTAGPVTFIAAVGGYFLGYGKAPAGEYLIFFVAYSVIAGVIGVGARLGYKALYAPRRRAAEQDFALVNDRLPDIAAGIRDLHLAAMEPETRRTAAAGMLLRHLDLSPDSVAVAVRELTGRADLAEAVRRIELYRRAGFRSRMQEVTASVAEPAAQALAELANRAPELQPLLRERLSGRAPSPEYGIPREEGFIERVLAAADAEDDSLMTLNDAVEMLVLAFELLNGRRILMLSFRYRGNWALAQATDELEARRDRYRAAKLKGYSRLRALVAHLAGSDDTPLAAPAAGHDVPAMMAMAREGIRGLATRVAALGAQARAGDPSARGPLRRAITRLEESLSLYGAMHRAFHAAGRRHAVFLLTRQRWEKLASEVNGASRTLHSTDLRRGLVLYETTLELDDKQKVGVSRALARYLRGEHLRYGEDGAVHGPPGREKPLDPETAKRVAMHVAAVLTSHVDLAQPDVQRAIDGSHAPNFTGVEPGASAQFKTGVATAMIQEVEDRLSSAAERLAARLVIGYGIALDESAIEFLQEQYGARRERLEMLAGRKSTRPPPAVSPLSTRPPVAIANEPEWQREIERAERLLERYRSLVS